ncbi:MAG: hydroxymethylglutaryl-CoA reductase, degradative [Anaerolineae bacterium]|nr:hydroxymethylglutaryl-CoA reductase, degradative [Anaerolineae bacterium]MDW8098814.1 hydroxymethylglutaryl-CoA reductase, degradative [Anaerolineae bacterium]
MPSSRISGFYRLSAEARARVVAEWAGLDAEEAALLERSLALSQADKMIENVIGLYPLPMGIAVNFLINGKDYLIPMVIEEPSVVAGASYAARLAREGGGFFAESDESLMIGQIQVLGLTDVEAARAAVLAQKQRLLDLANQTDPVIVSLHGGARDIEARIVPESPAGPMLVVHVLYDCRDAMGANMVNTACEALAPLVEEITGGRVNLRILSNLADRRLARARCRVPAHALETNALPGPAVVDRIVEAYALAAADPYRATTHNKGIMNGVDAVVLATGNDWRAIEAGAHAYAARDGRYRPLSVWEKDAEGNLVGRLEMPLALGIVGGATRAHPGARLALRILGVQSARELAAVVASVGLAQNLAALRALATEGIQRGHMALHARQVAIAAGAMGDEVDWVAEQMVAERAIRLDRAQALLAERRQRADDGRQGR